MFTRWKESVSAQIWSDGLQTRHAKTRYQTWHPQLLSLHRWQKCTCVTHCSTLYFILFLHTDIWHLSSLWPLSPPILPLSHLADKLFNPSHPHHGYDIILRCVMFCSTVLRSLVYDGVCHAFVCAGAALVSVVLSKMLTTNLFMANPSASQSYCNLWHISSLKFFFI